MTALESGEIDVGLLETTSGRLGDGRLMLLDDDRSLQPRENLVPVVRGELVRWGTRLTRRSTPSAPASRQPISCD